MLYYCIWGILATHSPIGSTSISIIVLSVSDLAFRTRRGWTKPLYYLRTNAVRIGLWDSNASKVGIRRNVRKCIRGPRRLTCLPPQTCLMLKRDSNLLRQLNTQPFTHMYMCICMCKPKGKSIYLLLYLFTYTCALSVAVGRKIRDFISQLKCRRPIEILSLSLGKWIERKWILFVRIKLCF